MNESVTFSIWIAIILYVDSYFIGKTFQKFIPSINSAASFILGLLSIFGVFQIVVYLGLPAGWNYEIYYWAMRILVCIGPLLALIFRANVLPKKDDLFALLFGIAAAFLLCYVSKTMTTNNVFFDSNYYLSSVIESSTNQTMGHVNYYNGSFLYGIDVFHNYQGNSYFWGMILRQVREFTQTAQPLTPVYIWSATIVYGLSLGSLVYTSCKAVFKKYSALWCLAIFCCLIPFYSNYFNTALAFFGNTIKTVLFGFILYLIYTYIKEKDEKVFIPLGISYLGILSFSSSGFFLSVFASAALFFYMVFFGKCSTKHYCAWGLSNLALVHYLYIITTSWHVNNWMVLLFLIIYSAIVILLCFAISKLPEKAQKGIVITFRVVFVVILIGLIYISYTYRNSMYGYDFFFESRSLNDMTLNYTSHIGQIEYYRNIVMWIIFAIIMFFGFKKKFVRYLWIVMLLFINPLVQPAITNLATSNVYCRVFEFIANPFTLSLLLGILASLLKKKWLSIPALICLGGMGVYIGYLNYTNIYSNYLLPIAEDYVWEDKVSKNQYDLYTYINENLPLSETDRVVILSQDISIKAYVSGIELVFGSDDLRDALDTIQNFEQSELKTEMSYFYPMRDYDYENLWDDVPDYDNTCSVIRNAGAQYVIMKAGIPIPFKDGYFIPVWYKAKDCAESIYENDYWVLLEVNK